MTVTLALVALLAIAGCGGSDETSHQQEVHRAAGQIKSIDREERTLVELRALEGEAEAREGAAGGDPETIEALEVSWQHQISRLLRGSTSNQIEEACEEVSESAFCKERKE
ncbi:MAG TPA: hypothetical protein VHS74_05615 [Solirubrobacterales bacterium]|jgi:hypothetical protein|nr:hypothetical protein [Solirubrobacterales bacterium]